MVENLSLELRERLERLPEWVLEEMAKSAIAPDVVALNVRYAEGYNGFRKFVERCNIENAKTQGGAVSSEASKYNHLYDGYWFLEGGSQVKPLSPRGYVEVGDEVNSVWHEYPTLAEMEALKVNISHQKLISIALENGLKPPKNVLGEKLNWCKTNGVKVKLKIIKYENIKGAGTPFIFVDIPFRVIRAIAKKYNIESLPIDEYKAKWQWVADHSEIGISITEGVKKAMALISNDIIAIASLSITTHSERRQEGQDPMETKLKQELKPFLGNHRTIFITFDSADTKASSRKAVETQTYRLACKLEKHNCTSKIVRWEDQECKGIDDYIFKHGEKALKGLFANSLDLKQLKEKAKHFLKQKEVTEYFSRGSIDAEIVLRQKYLMGDDEDQNKKILDRIHEAKDVFVKFPKGGGKSTLVRENLIKHYLGFGKKIISVNCRRSLGISQGVEWGLAYLDDLGGKPLSKHFKTDGSIALCVDSLLRLFEVDFADNELVIIFDEGKSFVNHLINAQTAIKDNRSEILALLEKLVKISHKTIWLDADLNNNQVEFCHNLRHGMGVQGDPKDTFILEGEAIAHNAPCYLLEPTKNGLETLRKRLFAKVESIHDEENCCIYYVDSKSKVKEIEEALSERYPEKMGFMQFWHGDCTDDPHFEQFKKAKDKAQYLKDINCRILVVNTVLQSGVDISNHHFKERLGEFHFISPDDGRQLLTRARGGMPLYLWISNAPQKPTEFSHEFDHQEILDQTYHKRQELLVHYNYAKNIADQLGLEGRDHCQKVQDLITGKNFYNCSFELLKAKIRAMENLAYANYREVFIEGLKREGHEIVVVEPDGTIKSEADREIERELKEQKEKLMRLEARAIAHSDDIPMEMAIRLSKDSVLTVEDRNRVTKAFLREELPYVSITEDFVFEKVLRGGRKALNGIKRYFMACHPEVAKTRDLNYMNLQLEKALTTKRFWLHDMRPMAFYLRLFEKLKLSTFIDNQAVVSKFSESLLEFKESLKDVETELKFLGFNGEDDTIKMFRKILEVFGFSTVPLTKKKNQARSYQVVNLLKPELFEKIWRGYQERYEDYSCTPLGSSIYKKENFEMEKVGSSKASLSGDSSQQIPQNERVNTTAPTLTDEGIAKVYTPPLPPSIYKKENLKIEKVGSSKASLSGDSSQQVPQNERANATAPTLTDEGIAKVYTPPLPPSIYKKENLKIEKVGSSKAPLSGDSNQRGTPRVGSQVLYQRHYPDLNKIVEATAVVKQIYRDLCGQVIFALDNFTEIRQENLIKIVA